MKRGSGEPLLYGEAMSNVCCDDETIKGFQNQRQHPIIATNMLRNMVKQAEKESGEKFQHHTRLNVLCDLSDNYSKWLKAAKLLMENKLKKVPECLVNRFGPQIREGPFGNAESREDYGVRIYVHELPNVLCEIELEFHTFLRAFLRKSSSSKSSDGKEKRGGGVAMDTS